MISLGEREAKMMCPAKQTIDIDRLTDLRVLLLLRTYICTYEHGGSRFSRTDLGELTL